MILSITLKLTITPLKEYVLDSLIIRGSELKLELPKRLIFKKVVYLIKHNSKHRFATF